VLEKAVGLARESGEALSVPYAAWAQTSDCLLNYGDPMRITATRFETKEVHPIDVHTMDDLLEVHRDNQLELSWGK
jgi:hypothetical protein